jgi:hypothetical protein
MTNKPLSQWTLEEVKEYCKRKVPCAGCIFELDIEGESVCRFDTGLVCGHERPHDWDLTDKPQFTEQDIADAKTLLKAFGAGNIQRTTSGQLLLIRVMALDTRIELRPDMFPSIQAGDTYLLSEIAGKKDE